MRSSIFRDVLESIRDRVDGTLAVSLIALDGIAIESVNGDSVPLDIMGAEFGGFIKTEMNKWAKVVKAAGIKGE